MINARLNAFCQQRDNTVTCCKKCNGRKGCLRPAELHRVGMKLQTVPRCPSLFELAAEATKFVPRRVHPTWAPYLGLSAEEVSQDVFFQRSRRRESVE